MGEPVRYYGKYRGTVVANLDPMQMGRIQVQVPTVLGVTPSAWAMPCVPASGPQNGMLWIPLVGSGVWVEFEQGDPAYPIWTGGWWGSAADVPAGAQNISPAMSSLVIQTVGQHSVHVNDIPGPAGGITLKSTAGASIVVNDTGIYIQNGKGASVTLVGDTVTVNNQVFPAVHNKATIPVPIKLRHPE